MSVVSARGALPPRSAHRRANMASAVAVLVLAPTAAVAQSYDRGPYMRGPTRPMDGSLRSGVYSAQAAPSYERTPQRLGYAAPPRDRPPIWSGLYAGANGGYGWQTTNFDAPGFPAVTQGGNRLGGHIGYNWQISNFVFGVESDLNRGKTSSATLLGGAAALMATSWQSSFRLRAGVAAGQALVYVTGGAAMNNQKVTLLTLAPSLSSTEQRYGTVFGAGVEVMLLPSISTRLEALHYDYRDQNGLIGGTMKQSDNVIRGGLTFHFN